jgi:hypothetical protein
MTLTSAPAIVTQLSTQLAACASWPGGATSNHWYPDLPWASATWTTHYNAVLEESERTTLIYAAGAAGIQGGRLKVTIHADSTISSGTLESLARTLLGELLTQDPGIVFRTADCGLSGTFSKAEEATDTATSAIEFNLAYGLTA